MHIKISQTMQRAYSVKADSLLKKFIIISVVAHVLFFGLMPFAQDFGPKVDLTDIGIEIGMETLPDIDSGQETLPNAEKAPEMAVPDNILPQLPKTITMDEKQKLQDNDESDKVAEEKPVDEKKDESNKITKEDLQKRLAIERLRKLQDKKSKSYKAPNVQELASLKKALEKYNSIGSLPQGTNPDAVLMRCKVDFDKLVRQNYELPKAYTLKALTVSIDITFTANGMISQADILQSSGDQRFDQLTLEGLKAAVPLPESCRSLAGRAVRLSFKS